MIHPDEDPVIFKTTDLGIVRCQCRDIITDPHTHSCIARWTVIRNAECFACAHFILSCFINDCFSCICEVGIAVIVYPSHAITKTALIANVYFV